MAQIQPVIFPIVGTAEILEVTILPFKTTDNFCSTYYELKTIEGAICINGNYSLTDEQYAAWGEDNSYVDQCVAEYLNVIIL